MNGSTKRLMHGLGATTGAAGALYLLLGGCAAQSHGVNGPIVVLASDARIQTPVAFRWTCLKSSVDLVESRLKYV